MKKKNKNKDTKAQKRLKQYDEIQALIRIPKYLQDYKDYEEGKITAVLISSKWGIPDPISPALEKYSRKRLKDIEILQPVMVIPHEEIPDEKTNIEKKSGKTIIEIPTELYKHHLEDGRYLHLKIDLMTTKGKIINGVKDKIEFYSQVIKKYKIENTGRNKETKEVDFWKVRDMHIIEKLKISEITKKLLKSKKKDSSVSNHYQAMYNAVKRGIAKAENMIQARWKRQINE